MKRPKINPERRAIYMENARRIVNDDRTARRSGNSQNTIGAIERALVAAFLEGREQCTSPELETEELTWLQIPPRSRDTLSSMTFWFSSRMCTAQNRAERIEAFIKNGKRRWRTVDADGRYADRSVADGSVQPLIRLALLEPSSENPSIYSLTQQGLRLCRDYWERSDRDDPTLPKISLR